MAEPGSTEAASAGGVPAGAGPRGVRGLAHVAIFTGIIAVLGLLPALPLPGMPVPITLQTLGVMLAGAILGPRKAAASVLLFFVLVAIGLPLVAGGRGGLGVFASPSVGFFVGWVAAALVIGWLTQRRGAPYSIPWGIGINLLGGIVVMYVFGLAGIMLVGELTLGAAFVATVVFVPGDVIKAVLAALIAKPVHAAYPGLLTDRRRAAEAVDVAST